MGAGSNGKARSFKASASAPAAGTSTEILSDESSSVAVVAWLDGTTIYYYAAGYTDSGKKLPLAPWKYHEYGNYWSNPCERMFSGCCVLESIDVSGFDTSGATDMNHMFYDCNSLTVLDVSGFDTSSVTGMYYMFEYCDSLTTIYASSRFVTTNTSS